MIQQLLWEQPQTLLGVLLRVFVQGEVYRFEGRVWVEPRRCFGVSLGRYLFASVEALHHEYGHCLQSRILGPLYLPLVGLPSFLRAGWSIVLCRVFGRSSVEVRKWYYGGYPEKWADELGGVVRRYE